nr:MAG TPA: hypothetical protein [Caudoviricetes sp.]
MVRMELMEQMEFILNIDLQKTHLEQKLLQ